MGQAVLEHADAAGERRSPRNPRSGTGEDPRRDVLDESEDTVSSPNIDLNIASFPYLDPIAIS